MDGLTIDNEFSTQIYLATQFDNELSSESRIIFGVFTTKEKAINCLTGLHGDLEGDPTNDVGTVPMNNPKNVKLFVFVTKLDEVAKFWGGVGY